MSDILEVLSKLEFNGTIDSKSFINKIFFGDDETYLNDLRKSFKSKFLNKFEKQLNSLETSDIQKIFDPLGLSKTVKNVDELKKDLQEYKSKLKKTLKKANKDLDDLDEVSSNSTNNKSKPETVSTDSSNTPNIKEQRTLGENVLTIKFSKETTSYIDGLFHTYVNKVIEKDDKTKELMEELSRNNNIITDKRTGSGFFDGLLGTVATLLIGGVGATLIAANWDNHVKPWLEDFFGTKLDFLDKFKGIVIGIGKFFTVEGLNLFGIMSKTFGGFLETSLSVFFKGGLGASAVGVGSASAGLKTLLPKIAGGIFGKIGVAALKTAPVIGSLISFYFAWDRFEKGDYIGSAIDLVGGLANLLSFTPLAPLALPISLGAAVLNGFLDYKAEGKTPEEQQKSKLNLLKGIGTGIYNFIKKIPIIGSIVRGAEGYMRFSIAMSSGGNSGDVISGLKMMEDSPFSILPSVLLPFYEAAVDTDKQGNKKIKFGDLYKTLGKKIISNMPDWLKSIVAPFFGIDSGVVETPVDNLKPEKKINPIETPEQKQIRDWKKNPVGESGRGRFNARILSKDKEIEELKNELDELLISGQRLMETQPVTEYRGKPSKELEDNLARYNEVQARLKELNTKQDNDSESAAKLNPLSGKTELPMQAVEDNEEKGSVKIFNGRTIKTTSPSDVTFSAKPNGFIDKGLTNLFNVMSSVDSKLSILINNQKNESSTVINNSTINSSGNSNNKEYLMSSVRDSNWVNRMNYYSASTQLKAV
jgi:hypothetical protein